VDSTACLPAPPASPHPPTSPSRPALRFQPRAPGEGISCPWRHRAILRDRHDAASVRPFPGRHPGGQL